MKTIEDLKLPKRYKCRIKAWLEEWLNMLIAEANGRQGTVYRANFEKNDFFYFTDCTDILSKDPEAKGQEENREIQIRKRVVMSQLLIKNLLGQTNWKKNKCSHCGFENRWIEVIGDGYGHFLYCPRCHYTTIGTYPGGYATCMENIRIKIAKEYREMAEPLGIKLKAKNDVPLNMCDGEDLKVTVKKKLKK